MRFLEGKDLQHGKRTDEQRGKDTRKTSSERTTTGGSGWRRVPPGGHSQRVDVRCEAEPQLKPDYKLQLDDCTCSSVQAHSEIDAVPLHCHRWRYHRSNN